VGVEAQTTGCKMMYGQKLREKQLSFKGGNVNGAFIPGAFVLTEFVPCPCGTNSFRMNIPEMNDPRDESPMIKS